MSDKPELTLYLAAPRGFCAGVDRAIKIVEMALEKWGAPVFVRHEIVHNKYVVDGLREKGAVFVKELDECPDDRPVIFSAHGVPKSVPSAAQAARKDVRSNPTAHPFDAPRHAKSPRAWRARTDQDSANRPRRPQPHPTAPEMPKCPA